MLLINIHTGAKQDTTNPVLSLIRVSHNMFFVIARNKQGICLFWQINSYPAWSRKWVSKQL